MATFCSRLDDDIHRALQHISSANGLTMAENLNRVMRSSYDVQTVVLSGAIVLGVQVHTTSGSIWHRGI